MIERSCPGKVNLLLNILGKRPDNFHEIETILHPIGCYDLLQLAEQPAGITLSTNNSSLPTDAKNLVYRAAEAFLAATGIRVGVRIILQKEIPLFSGLGGGSSNAAHTLLGLNELFGRPLDQERIDVLAGALGSDVPFFLQSAPALATGRGENVLPLPFFPALRDSFILLIHPGFGVSTPWAYSQVEMDTETVQAKHGLARKLIEHLEMPDLPGASGCFFNELEKPVLRKYPILQLYQKFLRAHGAAVALMSGSGSTTFALFADQALGQRAREALVQQFGPNLWTRYVPMACSP